MTNIDGVLSNYFVNVTSDNETALYDFNNREVHAWTFHYMPTLAQIVEKARKDADKRTTAAKPEARRQHEQPEGDCASCAACAACQGECGVCPYARTPDDREVGIAEAVHALLVSDAMTGNDEGTPSGYYVDAENVEYLVRTAVDAYDSARTPDATLCHNGHPFEPGVSTDHAPGESDPRWCNTCGEARTPSDLAAIVQEEVTGLLHPEFGTEWREPDGVIWQAIQQAKAEALESAAEDYSAAYQKVSAAGMQEVYDFLYARAARLRKQRGK